MRGVPGSKVCFHLKSFLSKIDVSLSYPIAFIAFLKIFIATFDFNSSIDWQKLFIEGGQGEEEKDPCPNAQKILCFCTSRSVGLRQTRS